MLALGACENAGWPAADELRQPTGVRVIGASTWLLADNGNLDRERERSSLVAIDLVRLSAALGGELGGGQASSSDGKACVPEGSAGRRRCDPAVFIAADATRRFALGGGNIALQPMPSLGGTTKARVLIPSRLDLAVTWFAVHVDGNGEIDIDCAQDTRGECDDTHAITDIGRDPAKLTVSRDKPYAWMAHFMDSRLTLIGLDGALPEKRDDRDNAFTLVEDDQVPTGGYGLAERPCDPALDAPAGSYACTRPYVYAADRYASSVRSYRVASGVDRWVGGSEISLPNPPLEAQGGRPVLGDAAFSSTSIGADLLVVQSAPAALLRLDTSLPEDGGEPDVVLIDSVPLCSYPNALEVIDFAGSVGDGAQSLAAVSCYGEAAVAIVDLLTFQVIAQVSVGEGPQEMSFSPELGWLFVGNVQEGSISVIELRPTSVQRYQEIAVLSAAPTRR